MSEYKYVFHGNEVPFEDVELAEIEIRDGISPFSVIAEVIQRSYDDIFNEVISKLISNNLQV